MIEHPLSAWQVAERVGRDGGSLQSWYGMAKVENLPKIQSKIAHNINLTFLFRIQLSPMSNCNCPSLLSTPLQKIKENKHFPNCNVLIMRTPVVLYKIFSSTRPVQMDRTMRHWSTRWCRSPLTVLPRNAYHPQNDLAVVRFCKLRRCAICPPMLVQTKINNQFHCCRRYRSIRNLKKVILIFGTVNSSRKSVSNAIWWYGSDLDFVEYRRVRPCSSKQVDKTLLRLFCG